MANINEHNDLEKFLILGKSSKGMGAVALIKQVIAHKKIFVFAEFSNLPNIQQLKYGDYSNYFQLLEIFSQGTYRDYIDAKAKEEVPEITSSAIFKLRQLTVVSLAKSTKVLSYDVLQYELDLAEIRQLEDILIGCIYSGLIIGHLNQSNRIIEVTHVESRDIQMSDVFIMLDTVDHWLVSSKALLREIDNLDTYTSDQMLQKKRDNDNIVLHFNNLAHEALSNEREGVGGSLLRGSDQLLNLFGRRS